jgi:hypothetical protein
MLVLGSASIDGQEVSSYEPVQPGPTGETFLGPTSPSSPPVTTFTLAAANAPTNWAVGDRLIITGDTPTDANDSNQDEQVSIQAITTDPATGNVTIKIDHPLQYLHYAPAGMSIYVADVSRNAVFESVNVTDDADRGQVMFMCTMNVQVAAAGFYGLGRTDKQTKIDDPNPVIDPSNPGTPDHPNYTDDVLDASGNPVMVPELDANGQPVIGPDGNPVLVPERTGTNPRSRYAVYFNGDMPYDDDMTGPYWPVTINDSVVVDSPGWGIANKSSDADVTNNVVFNATGAAFATEAGDEIGVFDHNIAIHSLGVTSTFNDIRDREAVQDFGFQGDGFWLQGGNVTITNNIATGQRGAGFVLLGLGLVQSLPVSLDSNGNPVFQNVMTAIPASELTWAPWAPTDPTTMVTDGSVPLKEFANNVAFADGNGLVLWNSLNFVADPKVTDVIDNLQVYEPGGIGVVVNYSQNVILKDVTVISNANNPYAEGIVSDNSASVTFDHVDVRGFGYGIVPPLQGVNSVIAGTFQDLNAIYIEPIPPYDTRVLSISDDPVTGDKVTFLNLSPSALGNSTQYDIYVRSNFDFTQPNIGEVFTPGSALLGTVTFNGQQIYFAEQAADFVPFPSAAASPSIPAALEDQTNAQLFRTYGLAIDGAVVLGDNTSNLRIHGALGTASNPQIPLYLASAQYTQFDPANPSYLLAYTYVDPSTGNWVTVTDAAKSRASAH